ncbi:MAG: 50S ribosomal protein L24 [Proteobacteria bacterium]|nr:50S ribosomal protein L24 [Pseudomonadota bacterium]
MTRSLFKHRSSQTKCDHTKCRLRVGDEVIVLAGADLGKTGKVLSIDLVKQKVLVEGVNQKIKHQKATEKMAEAGIKTINLPIALSNVSYYLAKEKKPSRIGYRWSDGDSSQKDGDSQSGSKGKKVRYTKANNQDINDSKQLTT